MPLMRTIFLSRGFSFGSTAADPEFDDLRRMLGSKGYNVVPVPLMWDGQTLTSYVTQLAAFYQANKSTHNTLMGGSLGAMASFIAAPFLRPDALVLCSLSAFFSEDLHLYGSQELASRFGPACAGDLRLHSATAIAGQVLRLGITTTLLYGELEKTIFPNLVNRVYETAAALGTVPVEIPGAAHKMREPAYVAGLSQVL